MTILYGILDDFGAVVRWQDYKPSVTYSFVTKKIPKVVRKPKIDWRNFEEALI